MPRCNKCNRKFNISEDRDAYFDYVSECGYTSGFPDFDEDYCFNCNASNLDWCMERLNDEDDEDPGVYRSYEEWEESGDEIDPADDALWLHDQE